MIASKTWTKEELAKWLLDTEPSRTSIEFSLNGGISWSKVQGLSKHTTPHDLDRLWAMISHGCLVRDVVARKKVTVTQDQVAQLNTSESSFFRSVAKADVVRHSSDYANVVRTDGGGYWFTQLPLEQFTRSQPTAKLVSRVKRTIYYDGLTANTNQVEFFDKYPSGSAPLRAHGFVFRLMPATQDTHIAHWWPVLKASHPEFDSNTWLSVRCARLFDTELDEVFRDMGNTMAVIGGKFVWGWTKRQKFGDTWIIPLDKKDTLVKRLASKGMAIEPTPVTESNTPQTFTYEVDPKYIMGIREQLLQLIQAGDKSAVIDNLFKVVEFRNKCVDELKELNKTIDVAREFITNG